MSTFSNSGSNDDCRFRDDSAAPSNIHSSSSNSTTAPTRKRSRQSAAVVSCQRPLRFVTWNCNGLTSRCTYNADLLQRLALQTNADVYCFQEVRLKANRNSGRSTTSSSNDCCDRSQPLPSEYQGVVQQVLEGPTVFRDEYEPYWSLADNKYSGTLTLIRKSLGPPLAKAFSTQSARNLLLNEFSLQPQDCGLLTNNESSSSSHGPQTIHKKQPSIKSFFAAKPKSPELLSSKPKGLDTTQHHPEGRFQFFRLEEGRLDLIQVYVPNNGDRAETWERRRLWDESLQEFLHARRTIYQRAGVVPEPRLLITGDFNVARTYRDGTHWELRPDGSVYEFWTDEAKCLVKRNNTSSSNNSSNNKNNNKHSDHVGIASFTPAERRRFNQLLEGQDLCDVWRELHPKGIVVDPVVSSSKESIHVWDQPNWTWRGHLSKDEGRRSKYEGKGQRLDYFLLSPSSCVTDEVESCDILGYGRLREGLFCGSDHCAVYLKLKDTATSDQSQA